MTERLSEMEETILDNVCMTLAGRAAEEVNRKDGGWGLAGVSNSSFFAAACSLSRPAAEASAMLLV